MQGFIPGSAATFAADFTLVTELGMGVALAGGAVLARRRRYRAHGCCQAAVVLLNLPLVVRFMARSFWRGVAPGLPADLGNSYYWLASLHGVLGLGAELLCLYILLAAGTKLLPARLRFSNYKPWMRAGLGLWWLVLALGVGLYVRWYMVREP